ncbi:MAG TPA: terpene cyclase/mutase family protein, partial [Caldilineae bacterium]|nr:terpene cyclase/mutase family protein [Caldilineae bacterium]
MKRSLSILMIVAMLVSILLMVTFSPLTAKASVEPGAVQEAIDKGIAWLVAQQNPDGSWGNGEYVAVTAFAVLKLEDRAFELGYESPFDPAYQYSQNVIDGLNYIFSQAASYGSGTGICFAKGYHEIYYTGIAMMAIAASRAPDRKVTVGPYAGWTYKQVLQGNVDFFVWSQNPDGGWRYWASDELSDNSNTGYAVLGLRYAESELYGFKIDIPQALKDNLSGYIDYIQCDWDGGSGYSSPCEWVNLLKTGNLLFEMSFVGDTVSTPRVMNAISYIRDHWNDPNSDPGWRPHHYQAMYCLMKGFQSLDMDTITVDGEEIDWFDEFATAILDSQNDDGSWPPDMWGDEILSTEWALLTLEKVSPPPPVNVVVDVPECACDATGYDVEVTYTVERVPVDGTLGIYKDGGLVDTVNLTNFTGTATWTQDLATDTPGTHTWEAELDVVPSAGGTPAHADDEASVKVCETPEVLDIPDQTGTPFEPFDLDDYLSYSGSLSVMWSAAAPAGWTVNIDENNVATVIAPEGAIEPAIVTFTASVECGDGVICSDSDQATFVPNRPPDTSGAYADPECLWPPNHKFVDINI